MPQVRLIDQDNQQVGVVDVAEAQHRANQAGLDLVEVAPGSSPPVCRIMDYGKWKYDQKKKEHKAKVKQHNVTIKEVRLRPKIEEHDREVKLKKAREFLEKGNKVQFVMLFRGREMAHMDMALEMMNEISISLEDCGKIESPAKRMGRRMNMVMAPAGKTAKDKPAGKEATTPSATAIFGQKLNLKESDAKSENT